MALFLMFDFRVWIDGVIACFARIIKRQKATRRREMKHGIATAIEPNDHQ